MPRPRPHRAAERGAALLMAVVSVAVLTALAVDLAYETQVRLQTAAHARDALRAEALAQSGVTMARLVVSLQRQVDSMYDALGRAAQQAGGGQAQALTAGLPRVQLWNVVRVSDFTSTLFGDGGAEAASPGPAAEASGSAAVPTVSYGDFQGGFEARIENESEKINVQLDDQAQSGFLRPQIDTLLRTMCDAKWDPFFNRTDADGQRYSRSDLVVHLRDWVDEDAKASSLAASFPGGNCAFEVLSPPIQESFSDENMPYDRGRDRYKAKNARLDSLEELHLVAGVTDAFMAAFGDRFTVYLPKGAGRDVNTQDPDRQVDIARAMAEPGSEVTLSDPEFKKRLHERLNMVSMGGFLSITVAQFAAEVENLKVPVQSRVKTPGPTNPFTDKTFVYRIRSSGVAGDVTHTTDAVVTYNEADLPKSEKTPTLGRAGNMNPPLGRLIRWREE